jgi:hypothetical protein
MKHEINWNRISKRWGIDPHDTPRLLCAYAYEQQIEGSVPLVYRSFGWIPETA